ncbi:MAG: OmpA family protein [Gammaproteobacteria bacterium]|nr:MAG: OmpA family protein [Gammaproteobacteria bacterium]
MHKLKLTILAGLTGSTLLVSAAHGWNGPSGSGDYGPVATRTKGGFTFTMGFNGHARTHYRTNRQLLIPRGVNFRFDSAELTPESTKVLDVVASNLRNQSHATLEIGGHASAEGDALYNHDLSARRSRAVRNYLVRKGVSAERLTTNGYGESRPLVNNHTENSRSLNRRVELTPVSMIASRR